MQFVNKITGSLIGLITAVITLAVIIWALKNAGTLITFGVGILGSVVDGVGGGLDAFLNMVNK